MKKIIYALLILLFFQNNVMALDTAETLYAKAYSHIYRNNPKTAINLFEKTIVSYPHVSFLYAGIGDAYLKEGNYSKAMDFYVRAQREKDSIDIYKVDFYNASTKLCLRNINIAINTLLELTKYFDNPIVYENINCLLNERYSQTKFIMDIYTDDVNLAEANQFRQEGKNEKALQKYLEILTADSKNYKAAANAGVTLIELKDYQLAEKYLLQALSENANSALILNNIAVAKHYQFAFSDAANYFQQAKKIKSDYAPAINNEVIANIHKDLYSYKPENINALLDIAKKDNDNYYAWIILSEIYFLKGNFKSANNVLSQLKSDYNFKLYYKKAYMAYANKNYSNALSFINNANSLYSANSNYYVLRGRILDALGDYKSAINDFNLALTKDKNNFRAIYYSAKASYNSGDVTSAEQKIKEFLNINKANTQSSYLNMLFE